MTGAELDALRSQLAEHEGFKLKPYRCTAGKLTIGVGRNLDDRGITAEEATCLLNGDINQCLTDLRTFDWWLGLDAVRQSALIDLRFNVGAQGFRTFQKLIAAMASRDYERAARELVLSKWVTQVQPARATRLVRMLKTGVA